MEVLSYAYRQDSLTDCIGFCKPNSAHFRLVSFDTMLNSLLSVRLGVLDVLAKLLYRKAALSS